MSLGTRASCYFSIKICLKSAPGDPQGSPGPPGIPRYPQVSPGIPGDPGESIKIEKKIRYLYKKYITHKPLLGSSKSLETLFFGIGGLPRTPGFPQEPG